jgi:hypothetical protein
MQRKRSKKQTQTAEQIIEEKNRVTEAVHEILHNPQTPDDLFQAVTKFVTDATNRDTERLIHTMPVLTVLIDDYAPHELMGAVIAARKKEAK